MTDGRKSAAGIANLSSGRDRENCRRCGRALPQPVVKIVERVVERVVVRHDPRCVQNLEQARQLLAEASDRLMRAGENPTAPLFVTENFPTMAEMERAMILAAYRRSDHKPLEAARLLGIGKTTLYRKLRALKEAA